MNDSKRCLRIYCAGGRRWVRVTWAIVVLELCHLPLWSACDSKHSSTCRSSSWVSLAMLKQLVTGAGVYFGGGLIYSRLQVLLSS